METRSQSLQIQLKVDLRTITLGVPPQEVNDRYYPQHLNYTVMYQGCISCGTCSYPELTEDHVLTSAYVKIFRIVTRNAVNKSF